MKTADSEQVIKHIKANSFAEMKLSQSQSKYDARRTQYHTAKNETAKEIKILKQQSLKKPSIINKADSSKSSIRKEPSKSSIRKKSVIIKESLRSPLKSPTKRPVSTSIRKNQKMMKSSFTEDPMIQCKSFDNKSNEKPFKNKYE